MLLVGWTSVAWSQTALPYGFPSPSEIGDLFQNSNGDPYSSIFLNQVFGPLFSSALGGGGPTLFSVVIGYFNVLVLIVGSGLFFYNATVGLLQSAYEGVVLGQR